MTSEQIRDPQTDHLLTPANCALVIIDYQPTQVNSIRSMDREVLVDNIVRVAKTAVLYGVPGTNQQLPHWKQCSRIWTRSTERRSTRGKTLNSRGRSKQPAA
jgi:hypothetical protein